MSAGETTARHTTLSLFVLILSLPRQAVVEWHVNAVADIAQRDGI